MSKPFGYPQREKFFAMKFTRILMQSRIVNEIGCDACLLIVHVASIEDAIHYSGPVSFWNSQLMDVMGFNSPKQLNRARQRAVDAGWLTYHRDGTRSVGHYFVSVPDRYKSLKGANSDQPDGESILSENGTNQGANEDGILSENGTNSGTNSGTNRGALPIPVPIPVPKRDAPPRFVPPNLEAVKAYCRDRKNSVDAEKFLDHYTANGWVQGKGKPIRDWQAAVRTWERNGLASNGTSANGKPSTYTRLTFE